MENIISVKPIETKDAQEAAEQAVVLRDNAKSLKIVNQQHYEQAAEALQTIKSKYRELEAKRKDLTQPLDQVKKRIMDLFRKPLDILAEVEGIYKKTMIAYSDEQERKRKEQEEKLRKEAEEKERREKEKLENKAKKAEEKGKLEKAEELRQQKDDVMIQAPILSEPEKPKGISFRDNWYAEVMDKSKLPMCYLEPNMQMLNKFAQATKGQVPLPGVVFKSEKILASKIA
jgi:hypothetical protein